MTQDPLSPSDEAVQDGERLMIAVNADRHPEDFLEHGMHIVPTEGHAWRSSHRHVPARYIGAYLRKGVRHVGMVAACVHLRVPGPHAVLWKYDDIPDDEAIRRAEEVRSLTRRHPRPCVVFLVDQITETRFVDDLPGGFRGSRQYFDLKLLEPSDVRDLGAKLRSETWATMLKRSV